VVGDFFKSNAEVLDYTDKASDVITWLRSKTLVLALLHEKGAKAVIRAVLTRWTAHYMAYHRLLELRPKLLSILYDDEGLPADQKLIVIGDAKAKAKSRAMSQIIYDGLFWQALARCVSYNATILVSD
jgi:hypothetical protein